MHIIALLFILNTVGDPNFVVAPDIVSTHGPNSITRNILQDRNGDYRFATWEGIVRYDGKLFTYATLKEGLRRFHVFSLLEDETGNLWFGMIRGGVYRYSKKGLRRYDGNSLTKLTTSFSTYIFEDRAGNLWSSEGEVNSREMTLVRYDGKSFSKTVIASDEQIFGIMEDKAGTIWFGTGHGVGRYDGKSLTNLMSVPNPMSKWYE